MDKNFIIFESKLKIDENGTRKLRREPLARGFVL